MGVLWLAAPQLACAFGADAHLVVGHIAAHFICPDARLELQALMPDYSLAEAGVWADRIRGDPAWDRARPWHYINVPDGMPIADAKRRSAGDVLYAIEYFNVQLADMSLDDEQRAQALKFLVHFVADIHQPLHVGRREDLGGNKIDVRVNGRRTNLHSFWDTGVLDGSLSSPARAATQLAAGFAEEIPLWQLDPPAQWAAESQALRPQVYAFGGSAGEPITLDDAYQARALALTEQRLVQAGVRLAAKLNVIWCPVGVVE